MAGNTIWQARDVARPAPRMPAVRERGAPILRRRPAYRAPRPGLAWPHHHGESRSRVRNGWFMDVTLCVLLWAHEGREAAVGDYEDRVLTLLADHGGRVIQRARTTGGDGDGEPAEVQILRFPSQGALEGFMGDSRRTALAAERDAAIARTQVLPVRLLHSAECARTADLAKGLGWPR